MLNFNKESDVDSIIQVIDDAFDKIENDFQFRFVTKSDLLDILQRVSDVFYVCGMKLSMQDKENFLYNLDTIYLASEGKAFTIEFPVYGIYDISQDTPLNLIFAMTIQKEPDEDGCYFSIDIGYTETVDDIDVDSEDDEPFGQVVRPYDLFPGI